MAKRIRRQVSINGVKKWICGNTEQEYADNLIKALESIAVAEMETKKHNLREYAGQWFRVFSVPNVEYVTATTYERQLRLHIYPVLGDMDIEDILPPIFSAFSTAYQARGRRKSR